MTLRGSNVHICVYMCIYIYILRAVSPDQLADATWTFSLARKRSQLPPRSWRAPSPDMQSCICMTGIEMHACLNFLGTVTGMNAGKVLGNYKVAC